MSAGHRVGSLHSEENRGRRSSVISQSSQKLESNSPFAAAAIKGSILSRPRAAVVWMFVELVWRLIGLIF